MAKLIFKVIGALLLLGSVAVGWFLMDYQSFREQPLNVSDKGAQVLVEPGKSLHRIALDLSEEGILKRPRYFVLMGRLRGDAAQIKAGEYAIQPGTTPGQLLDDMVHGRVIQHSLTVVEGWNFRQMMAAIDANPYLEHTLANESNDQIMAVLGHEGEHPEGRFFPDTYHFPRGLKDTDFLRRAYDAMQQNLQQEWENRAKGLPLKNAYQALILASIVEKETGVPEERSKIAGVFVRRLQMGMRLQTDPTVIYGMGLAYDGDIRTKDLKTNTPYNTYRIHGLPPTPIAMPGAEALHAALHPADGKALYFVSRGDGSHYFSATLKEHNAAVKKYQLRH